MTEVRFVLVRPETGGNVGAAARALKNTGHATLVLVAPRFFDAAEARRMAHGATDVLRGARVVASLRDAVADCRWVVGTSRRAGRRRTAPLTPRRFARTACGGESPRPLAIVFGPEKDGLASSELKLCHDLVRIPASHAQPSYNLAQAVLLIAYELFVTELDVMVQEELPRAPRQRLADTLTLEHMLQHCEAALLAIGFVRPATAPSKLLALRHMATRAQLTTADVRMLRGICHKTLWAVSQADSPASSERRGKRPAAARRRV